MRGGNQAAGNGSVTCRLAPPSGDVPMVTRPLCVTMIFSTSARPRPVPVAFGREERTEDAIALGRRDARAVVVDADAADALERSTSASTLTRGGTPAPRTPRGRCAAGC